MEDTRRDPPNTYVLERTDFILGSCRCKDCLDSSLTALTFFFLSVALLGNVRGISVL